MILFLIRRWLDDSGLRFHLREARDRLHENSTFFAIVSGSLWFLATFYLVIVFLPSEEKPEPRKAWYLDLNTSELFVNLDNQLPPIEAPSGPMKNGAPAGVRAYVFGCKNCEPRSRFVGYVEVVSRNAHQALSAAVAQGEQEMLRVLEDIKDRDRAVLLVRAGDGGSWYASNSNDGQRIMARVDGVCASPIDLRYCPPEE